MTLPKAGKEAYQVLHMKPKTNIQEVRVPLTLSYDTQHKLMHFIFPLFAANNGNKNDVIQHVSARYEVKLESGQKTLELNENDFEFSENNLPVSFPFPILQSASRSMATSVTFNAENSSILSGQGPRTLEIQFTDDSSVPLQLKFCFDLDPDQINELTKGEKKRFVNPYCD